MSGSSIIIEAILLRQQEDGWICPCREEEQGKYDLWAVLLTGKVLTEYAEFTGDAWAESALYTSLLSSRQACRARSWKRESGTFRKPFYRQSAKL